MFKCYFFIIHLRVSNLMVSKCARAIPAASRYICRFIEGRRSMDTTSKVFIVRSVLADLQG